MRKIYSLLFVLVLFGATEMNAQVVTVTNPGNVGPTALAATYGTLAAAITDLNTKTSITGPVTITLNSANPQTCPSGGYSITAILTGASATNQVTIAGSGNTITAPAPAGTAGNLNDAIFKFIGSDFMTLSGFVMNENAGNTVTTAASNTMVEWGVALLYASTTNGAQNITIQNNTITLNRTYQNTFGIYSNSTHTATNVTTVASATTTAGSNSVMKVYSNTISNVNQGIVVVGPTAIADANTGVEIGGASLGNTITNFGTTGTFSGYASVSGTVNGIAIRNSNGYIISNNTITSSVGGTITATLNGIQQQASSNTPATTFTNAINNNNISLQSGIASGTIVGITTPSGSASATSTLNINGNNFNTFGHTVAGTGAITFITNGSTHPTITMNSNTFTNIAVNTTGSVNFFVYAPSLVATGVFNINNNSIVTGFNKTGAGGTVTIWASNASSVAGSVETFNNNNFSNITLTGATTFAGYNNTDGPTTGGPTKTVTGNTISNFTGGSSAVTIITVGFSTSANISTNTISGITGSGAITGISITSCNQNLSLNTITGLASSGASAVAGISVAGSTSGSFTDNIFKNTICNLSGSNAGSTVNGILVSAGITVSLYNNRIADLRTPAANASNPLIGINITSTTASSTVSAYYNSVYINGTSSGALFGSSAISVNTTPTFDARNNVFVNTSTAVAAGLTVAYRRSSNTLTTYASTSNRNDLFATNLFSDGTTNITTLALYKSTVSTRDAQSISENPSFLSTTCGDANFLKINTAVATGLEAGGATVSGITDDFEGDTRNASTPDIGADEFAGTPLPLCTGTPANSTITGVTSVCTGLGTTLSLSVNYTDIGITYQWSSGTTPGGPYPNTLGTAATQATGNLTIPTYYKCVITCTNSGLSYTTVEKSVLINALPTVVATPSLATYCTPGGTAISIAATGAATYTWSPATGLSATTGTPVLASPSSNQTYTVTGTDGNGCVNTATSSITVAAKPTGVTATATPANICSGATSSLTGTGTVPFTANQYVFATSTGATLDPMTSATTVIASSTTSGGTGDDTPSGLLSIGFTFYYEGASYTQYTISPDGWIRLGNTAGSSEFTNAVTSTSNTPKLYALWDDLATGSNGNGKVLVTGSAPNRIFKVQWFVTNPRVLAGTANTTFQLWLYETTNVIEYRYGTVGTSASASAGVTGATATNFQSITYTSNTANNGTANDLNTTAPASGRMYTFTPPASLTYAWTAATNLVSPSSQNTATNALTATETFTLTVSNAGCTTTATATVTVTPLTAVNITTTGSRCSNVNFTATANTTGGSPAYNYAWSDGSATVYPNTQTVTVNKPAGSYTLSVTVTDGCGGSVPMTLPVTVNALPVIAVNPTPASARICGTGSVSMLASGGASYVWSPTTFLTPSNGLSATEVSAATTSTAYTVTGTDANGCVNTATQTVTVGPAITVGTVTATPATICAGLTSVLNASATASPSANYSVASIPVSAETPSGTPTVLTTGGTATPTPGGTGTPTLDDGYWDGIAIPFSFTYYGNSYATVRIGTNGTVQFGTIGSTGAATTTTTASSFTALAIPTAGGLDNFIAMPWFDHDASVTPFGTIRYFVNGTAPNRKFVISYEAVKIYQQTDLNTAQVILNETTNTVDILLLGGGLTSTNSKVMGIEGPGGTQGVTPAGRSLGTWTTAADEAWRFAPPSLNYSWSPSVGLTPSASVANPTTPALTSTTPYTVTATEPVSGCFNTGTVTVTVNPNFTVTASAGANGTISPNGVTTLSCDGTGDQTYTITPNGGYSISDVLVDNASVGPVGTYTFTDVTSNHTISATFVINCTNVSITSATASPAGPLCSGQTTTLTANGVAGTNAVVNWYTNPNGTGTPVGTGLTLSNVGADTYYARVTGDCGPFAQASVTVNSIANVFSGTGNWTDNARWSCGAPPATGDAVTIASGANATLNTNFTIGGSLTMTATSTLTVNPTRTLSVDNGATANFAGQSVTFKSDGTGTASLGQVLGTLSNATNVTVERFIPDNGFRSWRLLSVPTFGNGQTIRQAWQEGAANPLPFQDNLPGFGTQITGVGSSVVAQAAGFDSVAATASLLRWTGTAWAGITNTNTAIANFPAYFLFIRGDRTKGVTTTNNNSSSTTLRTNGTVYTGDQVNNIGTNAFALVPNLYPSAINFTGLTRTGGVSNLFYTWDSKKISGNSLGVYQTFSGTNSFNCMISGGSYTFGAPNTTIESGQGFFVQSTTAGTITLKETAKISGTNGSLGFRPSATPARIDTRLYNSNDEMLDANTVVFDAAYDKAVDGDDAPKYGNPGANFAIETQSKLLAIEGTQPVADKDVIRFRMWNLQQQNYKLEIAAIKMNATGLTAVLTDSYLKTTTVIDLSATTAINFSVDGNAGSSDANRFSIVFAKAKAVQITDTKQGYTIAPNPVENGVMNLQLRNQPAGKYAVRIMSNAGQGLLLKNIVHTGGTATQSINLPSGIARGTYQVEITSPAKTTTVQQLMVNNK